MAAAMSESFTNFEKAAKNVVDAFPYIDFDNVDQTQRFFNTLEDVRDGVTSLVEAFHHSIASRGIELERRPPESDG